MQQTLDIKHIHEIKENNFGNEYATEKKSAAFKTKKQVPPVPDLFYIYPLYSL